MANPISHSKLSSSDIIPLAAIEEPEKYEIMKSSRLFRRFQINPFTATLIEADHPAKILEEFFQRELELSETPTFTFRERGGKTKVLFNGHALGVGQGGPILAQRQAYSDAVKRIEQSIDRCKREHITRISLKEIPPPVISIILDYI